MPIWAAASVLPEASFQLERLKRGFRLYLDADCQATTATPSWSPPLPPVQLLKLVQLHDFGCVCVASAVAVAAARHALKLCV